MPRKASVFRSLSVLTLVCAGMLFAQQRPVQNVNATSNPYLAAAQRLCGQAFDKLAAAQAANKFDMQGHDQKAKDLLVQASNEIYQAAVIADKQGR